MNKKIFRKTLSANDVGATGGHQGGILVPKSETELLGFLPLLNPTIKNPDAWIECVDESGTVRKFRFVYYNNKLHDENGTRNEYRITYMTRYFREVGAHTGETFEISKEDTEARYTIRVIHPLKESIVQENKQTYRIKITSSWRRVH